MSDERRAYMDRCAIKDDGAKERMDLIPPSTFAALGRVLGYGARKYSDHNWTKGFVWSRVYAALLRHLTAWYNGEDVDPESGLSHLDHVLFGAMALEAHRTYALGTDDRHFNTLRLPLPAPPEKTLRQELEGLKVRMNGEGMYPVDPRDDEPTREISPRPPALPPVRCDDRPLPVSFDDWSEFDGDTKY